MGLGHSPSIILDGLLQYVDVLNPRCYPGSGIDLTELANLTAGYGTSESSMRTPGGISFGDSKNFNISLTFKMPNTAYTKVCWFNLDDVSTFQPLICGGYLTRHCMWMNKTDKLTASHAASPTPFATPVFTSIAGTTTLSTGVWYFGAITYSSTSGFNLYLNERRDQTSASTQTFANSSTQNYLGNYFEPYITPSNPVLNGKIGPAMIYSRVLSAQEVLQNYNATKKRYGY